MKQDEEDTKSCDSRAEIRKVKRRTTNSQKKFKPKKCHHCVLYSIIAVVLLIGIGVCITSIVFKHLSTSKKTYSTTFKPITIPTPSPEATTKEPNPSLIFDECEREFVPVTTKLPYYILSIAAVDVNNDSNIDVIFTLDGERKLYIIFNLGNNRFEKVKEYDILQSSGLLMPFATADMNNDNSIDIIFPFNDSTSHAIIFENNGQGEFIEGLSLYSDGGINSLCTGDIDRNGFLDIIISIYGFGYNQIGIHYQMDDSMFRPVKTYQLEKYPLAIGIVDLNHDDFLDLIVTYPQDNSFSTLLNTKSIESFEKNHYLTNIGPIFVKSADFNGDRHLDVVLINYFSNNIVFYTNDGTGRLTYWKTIVGVNNPVSFALADYNNDSFIDIIIPNYHSNNITVYFNDEHEQFSNSSIYVTYPIPHLITTAHMNQDDKIDLVFSNERYVAILLTRCDLP